MTHLFTHLLQDTFRLKVTAFQVFVAVALMAHSSGNLKVYEVSDALHNLKEEANSRMMYFHNNVQS